MNPALRVWDNPITLLGSDLRVGIAGATPAEAVANNTAPKKRTRKPASP